MKYLHFSYSMKHCYISCRCLNQMEKDGLSVDDIFRQCAFRQDERDMVLKAVRIVQPDYCPILATSTDHLNGLPALVQDYYMQVSQSVEYGLFTVMLLFRIPYIDVLPNNSVGGFSVVINYI